MTIACICGGVVEFTVIGIAVLIAVVIKKCFKFCRKSCGCGCHEKHPLGE